MELKKKAAAGLIYGSAPPYIDHLAPLCDFLKIPLIVTEDDSKALLERLYPSLQTIYVDYIRLPETVLVHFDTIFVCTPRALFEEIFFFAQHFHRKKIQTIWCPHGNSDKGHASAHLEALLEEKFALLYGDKMIDFLRQKNVLSCLEKYVKTGNFRKEYYLEKKAFYNALIEKEIFEHLDRNKKTILYAPTWEDAESSSSFAEGIPFLIKHLPKDFNLIIKPHPNLLLNGTKNKELIEKYKNTPGVLFLTNFPPIYPLLAITDYYIGDFSSIGYDFLFFDKPMFFLNSKKRDPLLDQGLYLFRTGIEVHPENYQNFYKILEDNKDNHPSALCKEVYNYTFGQDTKLSCLKQEIETTFHLQTTN